MSKQKIVGYAAFARWEVELARGKARGLIGSYGFSESDLGDIEQELLLQMFLKRETRESWVCIKASARTVMSRILDNRIRDIIKAIKTGKREGLLASQSLYEQLCRESDDEDALTYEDVLSEDQSILRRGRRLLTDDHDLGISLSMVLDRLTDIQKSACRLLRQGLSVTEVADQLGMKRTTLNNEIKRMQKVFYREGLGDYL